MRIVDGVLPDLRSFVTSEKECLILPDRSTSAASVLISPQLRLAIRKGIAVACASKESFEIFQPEV
jgi:hypothetical protein